MSTTPKDRRLFATTLGIAASIVALAALMVGATFTTAQPIVSESAMMVGKVSVVARHADGTIYDERHFDNLVLNDGFYGTAYRTFSHNGTAVSAVFDRIAIGTSNTAASATQHVLVGTELARGQDTAVIYNNSTKIVTIDYTFGAGVGTGTVQESGIFNSGTANTGPMLARQTFGAITKGASDSLTVTWTITLS